MNRSKIKGTAWETSIVDYLRPHDPGIERRALSGVNDRGDVAGIRKIVIEAKNQARIDLAGWLTEAETEATNAGADLGVVWAKRRGRVGAAHGYVIMSGAAFVDLLVAAGYLPMIMFES